MKIACILTVFPSLSETFVFSEMRALARSGHQISVLHFIHGPDDLWQADAAALRSRVLRGGPLLSGSVLAAAAGMAVRAPLRTLHVLVMVLFMRKAGLRSRLKSLLVLPKCLQLAADCKKWAPDHVHATWANHPALAALVIHRLTGIPFSISAHAGQDVFRDPGLLAEKVKAARFVAVCNRAAFDALAAICGPGHRDKLHLVHHGVDLRRFSISSEVAGRQDRGAPAPSRILFVGRLRYGKGLPYLLEAMGLVSAADPQAELVLVGDGPDRGALERKVEALSLNGRVSFTGKLRQEEVLAEMRRAAVLVLPSEVRRDGGSEGLPNVILEAMACGTPVVASRIAAVEEAIQDGHTGLLVPQRNPQALAGAIRRILDDPTLAAELGRQGRRLVEERFDREACSRRFVSLFRDTR